MDRIEAIRSFIEVASCGSFTQAAERLGLNRIRISRHIQEVEDWLQSRLLHRTTRQVSLTEAGRAALPLCEQLLNQAARLESEIRPATSQLQGSIRLASPVGLGQQRLYDLVEAFLQRHPQVHIHLQLADDHADLVDERVDVALRFSQQPAAQLIARRLMQVPTFVCAAPSYLQQYGEPQQPQQLSRHNCLTHLDSQSWTFSQQDQPLEVAVRGNFSANEMGVLTRATLQGLGISLLPADLAQPHLEAGHLRAILQDFPSRHAWLWAVYLSRSYQQPLVRTFIDFAAEQWQGGINVKLPPSA